MALLPNPKINYTQIQYLQYKELKYKGRSIVKCVFPPPPLKDPVCKDNENGVQLKKRGISKSNTIDEKCHIIVKYNE